VYRSQTCSSLVVTLEVSYRSTIQATVASGRNFRRLSKPPTPVRPVQRMFRCPFTVLLLTRPRLNALANHGTLAKLRRPCPSLI
jgi:hypothetical protein